MAAVVAAAAAVAAACAVLYGPPSVGAVSHAFSCCKGERNVGHTKSTYISSQSAS